MGFAPTRTRPRATALFLACGLAILATLSAFASAAAAADYPPAVEKRFLSSCSRVAKATAGSTVTRAQARRYCRLSLACIERRLTLRQFVAYGKRLQSGRRNPAAKVVRSCTTSAARTVRSSP